MYVGFFHSKADAACEPVESGEEVKASAATLKLARIDGRGVAGELTATLSDGSVYKAAFDATACGSKEEILDTYQCSTQPAGGGSSGGSGGDKTVDPTVTVVAMGRVRPTPMLVSGARVAWGDGVGSDGPATLNVAATTGGTIATSSLTSEAGGLAFYEDRVWTLDDDRLVSVSFAGGDLRVERTFASLDVGTTLAAVLDGTAILASGLSLGLKAYDLADPADEGTELVGTRDYALFSSPDGEQWAWVEARLFGSTTLNLLGPDGPVTLAELTKTPLKLAAATAAIYWLDEDGVWVLDSEAAPRNLSPGRGTSFDELVADDDGACWTRGGEVSCADTAGVVTTMASAPSGSILWSLGLDGGYVYWGTGRSDAAGAILRKPRR